MVTMYFVGVSTGHSAIRRIFPLWCEVARRNARLTGIDIPVGAPPAVYRAAIQRIVDDPDCAGALVTTHKTAVLDHAGDLFASLTPEAQLLGETSCILRRDGELHGSAPDVECSGASLREIADPGGRTVLILGSGGAGTALALHLRGIASVHATDVNPRRLDKIAAFRAIPHLSRTAGENDAVIRAMPAGTIVVNATGLGKDLPGSPVTPDARFPKDAIAWDLNYRGELLFLDYARAAGVRTADGWNYFVRGWSTVMSAVLGFERTGELMREFERIARSARN